jgi:hypothetical protein
MSTTSPAQPAPNAAPASSAGLTEVLEKIDRKLAEATATGEDSDGIVRPKESQLSTAMAELVGTINLVVIIALVVACLYLWSNSKPASTTVTSGTTATAMIIEWADARGTVTASAAGAVGLTPTQLEQLLASARPGRLIAIDQPDGKRVLVPMGNVRTVRLEPAVPGMALSSIRVVEQPDTQVLPVEQATPPANK